MRNPFSCPNPVNEKAARIVAGVALVLALVLGDHTAANAVLLVLVLVVAAGLESILGYCLGCRVFGLLMRAGLVPEVVCQECADVSRRLRTTPG